jgi:thiamine biosynthesis lipoprotein
MSLKHLAADYWTEQRTAAMGSTAVVLLGDAPAGVADWATSELARLERCWSRFRDDSELAHLHARAGSWTHVSAPMLRGLVCARDLYRATDGRFDPTIRDALERAGYDRSFELIAAISFPESALAPAPAPGFAQVEIDERSARVLLPPGVRIDLGGVGKGLAADVVARGAVDRGACSALVSLGGDMRACGEPPPDGAWEVPVEDPHDETRVAFVHALATGALVTSTTRFRTWRRDGRRMHHLIDPSSGDAARTGVTAVVAAAPDAWWAEGIAKSVLIAGSEAGAALARRTGVHVWIFRDDRALLEVSP